MLGENGRIGILLPANNSVLEPEIWSALPPGVSLHPTRLLVEGDLTPDAIHKMEAQVDRGVRELMATGVDLIVYADMVTTFIMEEGWNAAAAARIAETTGIPCVSAWSAMMDAASELGLRSIGLASPYPRAIHDQAVAYFRKVGFDVRADDTLDILGVRDVPKVTAEQVIDLARQVAVDGAEGIVLLATDLPTFDAIERLEDLLSRPVVTCNQAILWKCLRTLEQPPADRPLGRLLSSRQQ
ncbi:MAG: aspartate/glutamate racemase family protein [Azospirillaceae bacterium]